MLKEIITLAILGVAAAAPSPNTTQICEKLTSTVNGTVASDNFMSSCKQQLLVKGSPVTTMRQCTNGRRTLRNFERATCKKPSNGADDDDHCACGTTAGIECAAAVAGCAVACVASLGIGCAACVVGLGSTCCSCACDVFGCNCVSDCGAPGPPPPAPGPPPPAPGQGYYEDPAVTGSCRSGETDGSIQGVDGGACFPDCTNGPCPAGPSNIRATAQCALASGTDKLCALICTTPSDDDDFQAYACPEDATCKSAFGGTTAICTYNDASKSAKPTFTSLMLRNGTKL